jgi:hypothetical protein
MSLMTELHRFECQLSMEKKTALGAIILETTFALKHRDYYQME